LTFTTRTGPALATGRVVRLLAPDRAGYLSTCLLQSGACLRRRIGYESAERPRPSRNPEKVGPLSCDKIFQLLRAEE
jgi:hypothetical protein